MLQQLKQKLEDNPRLAYSTVKIYLNYIDNLINTYGENPTIEQLNKFIAEKCRNRQPSAKYAIKEFLNFKGRDNEYNQLVQAKIKKPIRPKIFLTKEKLCQIVCSIKKEPYKTIGILQMAFAARASGIIKIEKKKIRKEQKSIRFILPEKGDKPMVVYLKYGLWPLIEPYFNESKKFLFLEKEAETYTREQLDRRVSTIYKRYLEQLKEAAKLYNLDMSTHDIRRSVANIINNSTNDPRLAQSLLGHNSIDTTSRYLEDNTQKLHSTLLAYQDEL